MTMMDPGQGGEEILIERVDAPERIKSSNVFKFFVSLIASLFIFGISAILIVAIITAIKGAN